MKCNVATRHDTSLAVPVLRPGPARASHPSERGPRPRPSPKPERGPRPSQAQAGAETEPPDRAQPPERAKPGPPRPPRESTVREAKNRGEAGCKGGKQDANRTEFKDFLSCRW